MKLHLPKALLIAVLAAVAVPSTWAAFNGPADVTYATGSLTDTDTEAENIQLAPVADSEFDMTASAKQTYEISADGYHIKLSGNNSTNDSENYLENAAASSLWIAGGSFAVDKAADLSGAGTIYVGGGQIQFTKSMELSNNFSLGATSVSTGFSSLDAGLRIGHWQTANVAVTLTGDVDVQENTAIGFQNSSSLVINGALSGSGNISTSLYDGTSTFSLGGDTTNYTGNISLGNKVTLTFAEAANGYFSNSTGKITLNTGSSLDLRNAFGTSLTYDEWQKIENRVSSTAAGTFIKVKTDHNGSSGRELNLGAAGLTLTKNYELTGRLDVHAAGATDGRALTITGGATLKTSGEIMMVSKGKMVINNGHLIAGSLTLGHSAGSGYPGYFEMSSGSLQVGSIKLIQDNANTFTVTGGSVEFTGENVINRGGNTATVIKIAGINADSAVTLKAAKDWTLDGSGLTTAPIIGNVKIAETNTGKITLKNVTITDSVINDGALALGGNLTVRETIINNGTLEFIDDTEQPTTISLGSGQEISLNVKDAGTVIGYSDGDNGFVLYTNRSFYLAEGSGVTNTLTSVSHGDNTYTLTTDETGAWFEVEGEFADSKVYYANKGECTVSTDDSLFPSSVDITSSLQVTAKANVSFGSVTLHKGGELRMFNSGATRTFDIGTLQVDGSGVVKTVRSSACHHGTINISELTHTGDLAELKLVNGSKTTAVTTYNINGGSFAGTITLQGNSEKDGNRPLRLNLNNATVAENAVINFMDADRDDDKAQNYITLGLGVNNIKIAGLSGTTTNSATVLSTDNNSRTLEIAVAEGKNYSTNANINTSVTLKKTGDGTQTFTGSSYGAINLAGGSLAFVGAAGSSASIGDINMSANNTNLSFSAAEGATSDAAFTLGLIETTTGNYFKRNINVGANTIVTAASLGNNWGIGTIAVDGTFNITGELKMYSGNYNTHNPDKTGNIINGSGTVNAGSFSVGNVGDVTLDVASFETKSTSIIDGRTLIVESGNVKLGTLSASNGNIKAVGGSVELGAGTHNLNMLDASNGATSTANVLLKKGAELTVNTIWGVSASSVKLESGATMKVDGVSIKGISSETDRLATVQAVEPETRPDGFGGYKYSASSENFTISNAKVEVEAAAENGTVIGNRLQGVALSNTGTGLLTAGNGYNNLTELQALTGDINLTWYNRHQQQGTISNLNIAAQRTVGAYTGEVDSAKATVTVSGLTAGAGATLNANLILTDGATLAFDGALALGNTTLTLGSGLTLNADTLAAIKNLSGDDTVALFTGVGTLTLGEKTYAMGTDVLDATSGIDLSKYFTLADAQTPAVLSDEELSSGYYLGFDANGTLYAGLVPEPTTATLSLLALAGLAARRRRK